MVHGFKIHLLCNDRGEIITFRLTGANVDDRNPKVRKVLTKELYGKGFADRGYISPKLFDALFDDGIQFVLNFISNWKSHIKIQNISQITNFLDNFLIPN